MVSGDTWHGAPRRLRANHLIADNTNKHRALMLWHRRPVGADSFKSQNTIPMIKLNCQWSVQVSIDPFFKDVETTCLALLHQYHRPPWSCKNGAHTFLQTAGCQLHRSTRGLDPAVYLDVQVVQVQCSCSSVACKQATLTFRKADSLWPPTVNHNETALVMDDDESHSEPPLF